MHRAHASGGSTIHLAPGQRRRVTFTIGTRLAQYTLSIRYSNGSTGETELLRVELDGATIGSFRAQDTGDDDSVGWDVFVSDRAGESSIGPGAHTIVVQSLEGDGCIEIDLVAVTPVER
jgi:hypothetical protein